MLFADCDWMMVGYNFYEFTGFRVDFFAFAIADRVLNYLEIVHLMLLVDDFEGG